MSSFTATTAKMCPPTTAKWYKCKVIDTEKLRYGFSKGQTTYCRKNVYSSINGEIKQSVIVWSGGLNNHAIRSITVDEARKCLQIICKMDDKFNREHESDYIWVLNY